jgi:hypothetical protein
MSSTKAEEQKSSSNPSALQLEEKSRRKTKKMKSDLADFTVAPEKELLIF